MLSRPNVPIVDRPISMLPQAGQNAATVGENGALKPVGYYVASIKAQLARRYARDLRLAATDDPARFSRMVDGKGKQIGSAEQWSANIESILANPLVVEYFPDLPQEIHRE